MISRVMDSDYFEFTDESDRYVSFHYSDIPAMIEELQKCFDQVEYEKNRAVLYGGPLHNSDIPNVHENTQLLVIPCNGFACHYEVIGDRKFRFIKSERME